MKAYFELIRWKNLLFLLLALLLLNYCVAEPVMHQVHAFSTWQVFLLVLGIILEAAGGYAINDYFDIKIDAINRPQTRVVGRLLDRNAAMHTYLTCSIAGALSGLAVSLVLHSWTLGVLFLFMPGMMWFYSSAYKRQVLLGNLMLGISVGLAVLSIAFAQNAAMHHTFGNLYNQEGNPIFHDLDGSLYDFYYMERNVYIFISCFAVLAALLTFIHAVIRNCACIEGDAEMECRTLPIRFGMRTTKIVLYVITLLTAAAVYFFGQQIPAIDGTINLTQQYLLFLVVIPLFVLLYIIYTAQCKPQWQTADRVVSAILLASTLYSIIFYIQLRILV